MDFNPVLPDFKIALENIPISIPSQLHIRKKLFLKAYAASGGNVKLTCSRTNIPRRTYYNWLEFDPDFATALDTLGMDMIEFATVKLLQKIAKGHTPSIKFFLRTFGADRGYGPEPKSKLRRHGQVQKPNPFNGLR